MGELTVIGLHTDELHWLRLLVALLRHPDPGVSELARQAVSYLTDAATRRDPLSQGARNPAG